MPFFPLNQAVRKMNSPVETGRSTRVMEIGHR
jgi:hypothetical protein